MHGCHNYASDPLRNSCDCHSSWSSLGSVIIYGLLVQLMVVVLKHCVLLRVLRLVGVKMSDFSLELPVLPR